MTRPINVEAEATAVMQTLRVTCRGCGQPFPFRVTCGPAKKKSKIHGPTVLIEWLCDACFDRWCWEHEPLPPGAVSEQGAEDEERCDE